MKYLQRKGYRVIPINPMAAGETILGEYCYKDLKDLPIELAKEIKMVDIFRNSEAANRLTDEAISTLAQYGSLECIWMQLGVRHDDAAERAKRAGLTVIMDRCPKIEYSRLFKELGSHGFDTGIISSKRSLPGIIKESNLDLNTFGFSTRAVHAGASPDPSTGARGTPIHQSTAFVFDDVDHAASLFNLQTFGNVYGRLSNPTTAVLEERIASLEGGRGATCTASGHSAQLLALFALMEPGDTFVAANKLYGGSITQFGHTIKKFNWDCTFVDTEDLQQVEEALQQDKCKALWVESLANPGGSITDLEPLSYLTEKYKVPLIVDNTMATPYLCRPIEFGADLVVHSTTKFLSGHGNAMGGCIVDSGKFNWNIDGKGEKFKSLCQPSTSYHGLSFYETFGDLAFTTYSHVVGLRDLGPTMAPMNAYLSICGIETLPLRMDRHVKNANYIAKFLSEHPKVDWVSHASLPESPHHERIQKYCPKGAGSVFTIGLKEGFDKGVKVVENVQIFSHLANIGDTRSLILHPASTTHRQLTEEQRIACGASNETLRLSIGIEDKEDLIADLENALQK
eukprot:g3580.t1